MRKALSLILAVYVALGAAASWADEPPHVSYIPDVILSEGNTGQTGDNYYVFDALNLSTYIKDDSAGLKAAFTVPAEARNISISGKSQIKGSDLTAAMGGVIADSKNVLPGAKLRATADQFNQNVGVPAGVPAEYYGFNGVSETFVTVIAGDGANMDQGGFWVKLQADTTSKFDPSLATVADVVINDFTVAGAGELGDKWAYFTGSNDLIQASVSGVIGSAPTTGLTVGPATASNTKINWGYWINYNVSFAPNWIPSTLMKVNWLLSSSATSAATTPGFRSLLRVGGGDTNGTVWRLMWSELMYDNTDKSLNCGVLANNHQTEISHYYSNAYASANAMAGTLTTQLDMCDFKASRGDCNGTLSILRCVVEVLPTPTLFGGNTYDGAADLATRSKWGFDANGTVAYGPIDGSPSAGAFKSAFASSGLTITNYGSADKNIYGTLVNQNIPLKISDTAGSTVHCRATVKNNMGATDKPGDFRLRFYPSYSDCFLILHVPGWYQSGNLVGLNIPAAGASATYDLFMDTPQVPPVGSPDVDATWSFAVDPINYYGVAVALGQPAWPKTVTNITITGLTINEVLR